MNWWYWMSESFIIQGNKSAAGPACDRTNRLTETLVLEGFRLMPQSTRSPLAAYSHNLDEDIAELRKTYRRLIYETHQSPGSGRLADALGWDSDRFTYVEPRAKVSDISEEYLACRYPNAAKRHTLPRHVRAAVWDKTGGACSYCGKQTNPFADFTIDHVYPVALGGTDDIANLVPSCRSRNSSKGARA